MGVVQRLFLPLLSIFFLSTVASHSSSKEQCVYNIYVQTGTQEFAGTDSKISLVLGGSLGAVVKIDNLEDYGLMDPGHDYFERGDLDIFRYEGACLHFPLCSLIVTSDGTGSYPKWYCDYVEVIATGANNSCYYTKFNVSQWLAVDRPPYELFAEVNYCGTVIEKVGKEKSTVFWKNNNMGSE